MIQRQGGLELGLSRAVLLLQPFVGSSSSTVKRALPGQKSQLGPSRAALVVGPVLSRDCPACRVPPMAGSLGAVQGDGRQLIPARGRAVPGVPRDRGCLTCVYLHVSSCSLALELQPCSPSCSSGGTVLLPQLAALGCCPPFPVLTLLRGAAWAGGSGSRRDSGQG